MPHVNRERLQDYSLPSVFYLVDLPLEPLNCHFERGKNSCAQGRVKRPVGGGE